METRVKGEKLDIVRDILIRAMAAAPSLTEEVALEIERSVRMDYGGNEVYVRKDMKNDVDKDAVVRTYVDEGVEAARDRFGISRASLYRLLKRD